LSVFSKQRLSRVLLPHYTTTQPVAVGSAGFCCLCHITTFLTSYHYHLATANGYV